MICTFLFLNLLKCYTFKSLNLRFCPIHVHYTVSAPIHFQHVCWYQHYVTYAVGWASLLVLKPNIPLKALTNKLAPYIMFTEYLWILNFLSSSYLTETPWENPNHFCNYDSRKRLIDRTIHRDWPLFCSGNHRNMWFHDMFRLRALYSTVHPEPIINTWTAHITWRKIYLTTRALPLVSTLIWYCNNNILVKQILQALKIVKCIYLQCVFAVVSSVANQRYTVVIDLLGLKIPFNIQCWVMNACETSH